MAIGFAHWRPVVLLSLMFVALSRIAACGVFLPARLAVARHIRSTGRNELKSYEEIMEMLEAFDLTGSFRAAAGLAGCSHHTVEYYVALREQGLLPTGLEPVERVKLIDPFLAKVEEWVERSKGAVRGDVVFAKLQALGFTGSARTTRRALSKVKANYRTGNRRVYRPWTEPVKGCETFGHADLMSASRLGSLIQAMVGSAGGSGWRCPNRAGFAW